MTNRVRALMVILALVLAVVVPPAMLQPGLAGASDPSQCAPDWQRLLVDTVARRFGVDRRLVAAALARAYQQAQTEASRRACAHAYFHGDMQLLLGPIPQPVPDRQLQSALDELLSGRDGSYGVAVRNLQTGQTALVNADELFRAASTYKLLVMYRVHQQVSRRLLDLDDSLSIIDDDVVQYEPPQGFQPGDITTVGEALEVMITFSSNSAAYALARQVGGWNSVLAAAAELGMDSVDISDGYFVMTPIDLLAFLESLIAGRLISEDHSRQMLHLMQGQAIGDRVPARLPDGVLVAHKTGNLSGVVNDVGVIQAANVTFAIAVLSDGVDETEANAVIAELSLLVYEYFVR